MTVGAETDLGATEETPTERSAPPRWAGMVHWAALAVIVAAVALIAVLVSRHLNAHESLDPGQIDPDLVPVMLGGLALVLAGAVFVLRPERGDAGRLVATSGVWSAVLLLALVTGWWLIDNSERQTAWYGTPVTSEAAVDRYLATNMPVAAGQAPRYLIPTGVMIQSLEFVNANNFTISGYVWQKYGPDVPADVERGIVFPEAVKEAYQATQVYKYTVNGVEVIGWYFAATVRQTFDYGRYPFDRQDLWLRMWHPDFERDVQLVPDFASYFDIDPTSLPGVENQFVYNGWEPLYSGFSFARNTYDSSFGLPLRASQEGRPELYFNFVLKRAFLGPFTDHIIFALAATLLLFGLLTLTTSNELLQTKFGLSTAGVLASVSGIFFAVILKHNQIRTGLQTQSTTYLEAVYFVMYFLLILVALNAILLASPYNVRFVEYRHNLLPKLLYWPLLLGLLLVITLDVFYF